jgi:mycobactin peptide synthetase MbtE
VYFTSGSTGRPKGALSTHRGTLRTLLAPRRPRLGSDTVTLSAAPLPWDAFTLELWSALLHGGTCVFPGQDHLTPAELRRGVAARGEHDVADRVAVQPAGGRGRRGIRRAAAGAHR